MSIERFDGQATDFDVDVAIVGAGGCGLTAALAANQHGASVLVLERDPTPMGSTGMSTGLIPAAGTRFQEAEGIDDSADQFATDIVAKTGGETDPGIAMALANASARTIEWLVDDFGIPLSLVTSFRYPGHSAMRMHGTPNRTGKELMGALCGAVERNEIPVLCDATVTAMYADETGVMKAIRCTRPDGQEEVVGVGAVVLACCGFGANESMVKEFMPEIANGVYYGHPGNLGDAIRWGRELGAGLADMTAYQGHGGLAKDRGVPILWPVIMQGGIQVNADGRRFSNEARGYSEQAVDVLQQPGGWAWMVYDLQRHDLMLEFEDYHDALAAGAVRQAPSWKSLARDLALPFSALNETVQKVEACRSAGNPDQFGREFAGTEAFSAPFFAAKVTGALFHTQGGLAVDENGRVLRSSGECLPNLYAGGGAARGVSGAGASGYMAGNGLLTATSFGRLAGLHAASLAKGLV
ncbi:MAG: FAD-dependent oxidoreductase [Woeseiaceae bacterium]